MEQWKTIKGYEGMYEVSTEGNVRSHKGIKPRILKPQITPQGYAVYRLYDVEVANEYKQYSAQKLVCDAFLEEIDDESPILMDRDHINGIRTDNRLENLQIITHMENISKVDYSYRYKAVAQYSKSGKLLAEYSSIKIASDITGVGTQSIGQCVRGKIQTSGGFIWKYKGE